MARPRPATATKAELQRKVSMLEAQLVHQHHFADAKLAKANTAHFSGSAVVLSLTNLSGADIIEPIAIRDGLSDETIYALRRDIRRSYEVATVFKPAGL